MTRGNLKLTNACPSLDLSPCPAPPPILSSFHALPFVLAASCLLLCHRIYCTFEQTASDTIVDPSWTTFQSRILISAKLRSSLDKRSSRLLLQACIYKLQEIVHIVWSKNIKHWIEIQRTCQGTQIMASGSLELGA